MKRSTPLSRSPLARTGTQTRKPLSAKPRSKGNRAEREIIDIFKAHGWTGARRNWQSGGQGGGDILGGPAGCNVEVKHREVCTIWSWIAQSENDARPTDIPLVIHRRNHQSWHAVLPEDEWIALATLRNVRTYVVRHVSDRARLWEWISEAAEGAGQFSGLVPVVEFSRKGEGAPRYVDVPLEELLALLRMREAGL